MEINPRVVFERLFGDAKSKEHRLANMRADRSILDSIRDDEARLKGGLGAADRARIADYLDNIREIERRIQTAETQAAVSPFAPEAPVGVPELYDDHVALMFDLMVIAYQAELTRVATFMLGRELTNRTYPQIGVPDPHHAVSHHQNSAESMVKHAKINTHHLTLFAEISSEDARHARRRRLTARSLDARVWKRDGRREPAFAQSALAPPRRRSKWPEGQQAYQGEG